MQSYIHPIRIIFYHSPCSQRIHKLGILPVRQIQPFLVLQLHILGLCSQNSFLGILPPAIPVDEQHVHETHAPAADDSDLGGNVAWSIFGSEGLWADDVADAGEGVLARCTLTVRCIEPRKRLPVSDEIQSGDCSLLGVAGDITADQRQESDEWCGRSLCQVVPCKTAVVVAEW
jgi:hypothetical protein